MNELIAKVRDEAKLAGENERKLLFDALRDLSFDIEKPQDTMQRIMFMNVQITVIRIAYDLNLFKIMVKNQGPLSVMALAQETKANVGLMKKARGVERELRRTFFVDVGGGLGQQCIALRKDLPVLKNKILLQDQAMVLGSAIEYPRVEKMPYDFFTEQPVKGAKTYYFRNIVHDYPEDKATTILNNLKGALAEDSVILIDDMVIPDVGAHWHATQLDICFHGWLGFGGKNEGGMV